MHSYVSDTEQQCTEVKTSQPDVIPLYNILETSDDMIQGLKLGARARIQGLVAFDEVELGVLQLLEQRRVDVGAGGVLLDEPGGAP